jgi:hypothetical protein
MEFVAISEHMIRVSRFLYLDATIEADAQGTERDHYAAEEFWRGVAEPLHIGGSIERIGVNPSALDPGSSLMCSTAWEHDLALSELTSAYLLELTRFMWAWISLEKLTDTLCGNGGGRTERMIHYLKSSPGRGWNEAKGLGQRALELLRPEVRSRVEAILLRQAETDFAHIHICREARNDLFHANSVDLFPSDEYQIADDPQIQLPKVLCRTTLIIIQSILHTYFYKSSSLTGKLMPARGIMQGVTFPEALRRLHFESDNAPEHQPELFPATGN